MHARREHFQQLTGSDTGSSAGLAGLSGFLRCNDGTLLRVTVRAALSIFFWHGFRIDETMIDIVKIAKD